MTEDSPSIAVGGSANIDLVGLSGADDRMPFGEAMRGRVFHRAVVAAQRLAADEALAQMDPLRPELDAALADVLGVGWRLERLDPVLARSTHVMSIPIGGE